MTGPRLIIILSRPSMLPWLATSSEQCIGRCFIGEFMVCNILLKSNCKALRLPQHVLPAERSFAWSMQVGNGISVYMYGTGTYNAIMIWTCKEAIKPDRYQQQTQYNARTISFTLSYCLQWNLFNMFCFYWSLYRREHPCGSDYNYKVEDLKCMFHF